MDLGGEQGRRKKTGLHINTVLMAPSLPQTECFAFCYISASSTMASKMSDSHLSILDHSFLSFQLFITLDTQLFFIFTETSNTLFLHSLHSSEHSHISSFCTQPRILRIFFLRISLTQRYPLLHALCLLTQLLPVSWMWDQGSYTRLHAQKVASPLGLRLAILKIQ